MITFLKLIMAFFWILLNISVLSMFFCYLKGELAIKLRYKDIIFKISEVIMWLVILIPIINIIYFFIYQIIIGALS